MTEGDEQVEPFGNLPWVMEQLKHGFERLAHVRHYSDDHFRKWKTLQITSSRCPMNWMTY